MNTKILILPEDSIIQIKIKGACILFPLQVSELIKRKGKFGSIQYAGKYNKGVKQEHSRYFIPKNQIRYVNVHMDIS